MLESPETRKIVKSGTSLAVHLPMEWAKRILNNIKNPVLEVFGCHEFLIVAVKGVKIKDPKARKLLANAKKQFNIKG